MSLEVGGRADKYGNEYENRYLVKLFIRLIRGEFTSIVVEPLGETGDFVEYVAITKDGIKNHYQCKADNGACNYWSIRNLQDYEIFKRAEKIIMSPGNNEYYFISPLPYNELDQLCNRSRTNNDFKEFRKYQLTNKKLRDGYKGFGESLGLDLENKHDCEHLYNIISHCYFELVPSGAEALADLEDNISARFTGKVVAIRSLLEKYPLNTGSFGKPITANDLLTYLEKEDIYLRTSQFKDSDIIQIRTRNNIYWGTYTPINNNLIHREATTKLIERIEQGNSAILHGSPGSGKSGCLQELKNYLDEQNILYLAVKLDQCLPKDSADIFGHSLGLSQSPIFCLSQIASGAPCVLIMDQLDALRWSNAHSSTALTICKELIHQCKIINTKENGHISIIFSVRTFDLENDNGLKSLFHEQNQDNKVKPSWEKIEVDNFTTEEVNNFIGKDFLLFPQRLQKLLLIPSNLYVWTNLGKEDQSHEISSTYELLRKWWQQILKSCEAIGLKKEEVINCKNKIIQSMKAKKSFFLSDRIFTEQDKEIDVLVSLGLLTRVTSPHHISFVHQSFFDHFMTEDIFQKLYNGTSLVDLIDGYDEQTPMVRYQFLTVLENLINDDQSWFEKESRLILESDNIRYYFKCAVFEILGQCDKPKECLFKLIEDYLFKEEWHDYIYEVVLSGHPQFVTKLPCFVNNEWYKNKDLSLLKSIISQAPDFVADVLSPFVQNADSIRIKTIYSILDRSTKAISEKVFKLEMILTSANPSLLCQSNIIFNYVEHNSPYAIRFLDILLKAWPNVKAEHVCLASEKKISKFIATNSKDIFDTLFPRICEITQNYQPVLPEMPYNSDYKDWFKEKYPDNDTRQILELVIGAAECLATTSPDIFWTHVEKSSDLKSGIGHEVLISGILKLPTSYSDKILQWIMEDFTHRIFVFSENLQDYLNLGKKLIARFSPYCNDDNFKKLEQTICNWKESPERMLHHYQRRLEINQKNEGTPVYYAFWGHLQKALLPHLDSARVSPCTQNLIKVLNRNKWIRFPYFYCGISSGSAGFVTSPVSNRLSKVTDKGWLQIINTPPNEFNKWKNYFNDEVIEASHETFASSFGQQAKLEPLRFAMLCLKLPKYCNSNYISQFFSALEDATDNLSVPTPIIEKIITRFWDLNDDYLKRTILEYIEKYPTRNWSTYTITLITKCALESIDPKPNEYPFNPSNVHESSFNHVLTESLNHTRSRAFYCIAALIWKGSVEADSFIPVIQAGLIDTNAAVRIAVMHALAYYYNSNKDFAYSSMLQLIGKDERIMCMREFWEITCREYQGKPEEIRKLYISHIDSTNSSVADEIAGPLCALAIFGKGQTVLDFLLSHNFSEEQKTRIINQAIYTFNDADHHYTSREILTHFVKTTHSQSYELYGLFSEKKINIKRDHEFIKTIMSSECPSIIKYCLEYLAESDDDICEYIDILSTLGKKLNAITSYWDRTSVVNNFIKCVIKILDSQKATEETKIQCLDLWDDLYRSDLQQILTFAQKIDCMDGSY